MSITIRYTQVNGKKKGLCGTKNVAADVASDVLESMFNSRLFEARAIDEDGDLIGAIWKDDSGRWNWYCWG